MTHDDGWVIGWVMGWLAASAWAYFALYGPMIKLKNKRIAELESDLDRIVKGEKG